MHIHNTYMHIYTYGQKLIRTDMGVGIIMDKDSDNNDINSFVYNKTCMYFYFKQTCKND